MYMYISVCVCVYICSVLSGIYLCCQTAFRSKGKESQRRFVLDGSNSWVHQTPAYTHAGSQKVEKIKLEKIVRTRKSCFRCESKLFRGDV